MNIGHVLRVALTFVLLSLAQAANADTWLRADTRHFVVYSNVGESTTREYLEQLAAFKHLADLMLGTDPRDTASASRFTIYLLDRGELLKTIRPKTGQYVAGFYTHCVEGSQAFVQVPKWFGAESDFGLQILLHEYAHHLMFSRMRRFYPGWYVEGFAEYMSTTKLQRGKYQLGVRNVSRAAQLAGDDRWLDFEIMLDPARFAAAVKQKKVNAFQYYAQSWLLAHYMLTDSERTQTLNSYFDRVGRGEDGVRSFEAATGMTVSDLDSRLRPYSRNYSGLLVKVPELPDASISVTRLPKDQGDYLLEDAALQSCPKEEYGQKLTGRLRALRAKNPGDPQLRVALSRAELLFGDPEAVRRELEPLIASQGAAFDVAYLLGRGYYEEASRKPEAKVALMNKASEQFLKAYQLDKTHAPNLYFLSKSLDGDGAPSKSVVNAGMAATLLAPSVPEYAIHAAVVNMRSGDRDTAIRVMQPFANNPHRLEYATRFSAVIDAIRANEEAAAVMTRLRELEKPEKDEKEDKETVAAAGT